MIAIDTNLLVYASMKQSSWNARAFPLIGDLAASGAPWGIPAICLAEFFSIVTNQRLYRPCLDGTSAMAFVDQWLACPTMTVLGEDANTWEIVRDIVGEMSVAGPAIHDARIAAICIQHDVAELWTHDRGFSRFAQLRMRDPLLDPLPTRASGSSGPRYRIERRGRPPAALR